MIVGLFCCSTDSFAQRNVLDLQFGGFAFFPGVNGKLAVKQRFTHNYWTGIGFSTPLNAQTRFHTGVFTNGVLYRYRSVDSPTTSVITMNYISMPLQLELNLKNSTGFRFGIEPKWHVSGHKYTAEPSTSRRMVFPDKTGEIATINMALRAGLAWKFESLNYFLMGSADVLPYRTALGTAYFDRKIILGFTVMPLWRSKK